MDDDLAFTSLEDAFGHWYPDRHGTRQQVPAKKSKCGGGKGREMADRRWPPMSGTGILLTLKRRQSKSSDAGLTLIDRGARLLYRRAATSSGYDRRYSLLVTYVSHNIDSTMAVMPKSFYKQASPSILPCSHIACTLSPSSSATKNSFVVFVWKSFLQRNYLFAP